MALTYRQVSDLYGALNRAGVTKASLPDWAAEMNALSGTDLYAAGQHDNLLKRASVGLDRLLERTGLPEAGAQLGQQYGEIFGAPEQGRAVGEKLARGTANFAPMFIPGAGWAATAGRLGLTGLLSGAETYTETGSPAAGLISGATAAAMPAVANAAEQATLRGIGGRLVAGPLEEGGAITAINRLFPKTLGQGVASQAAGQAAAAGFGELSSALQSGVDPNREYHFDPKAALINMTLGQAPFAGIYLTKHGRATLGGETTARQADALEQAVNLTRRNIELKTAADLAKTKPGLNAVPDATRAPLTPEQETERNTILSRLRTQQRDILADPNLSPEAKASALAPLVQADAEAVGQGKPGPDSIMGQTVESQSGRVPVVGKELRNDPRSRTILVADDPANPENLRGKVVNYSKGKFESAPNAIPDAPGFHTFGLPDGWFTVLPDRGVVTPESNQPELPTQAAPKAELFHHEQALQEAHNEFEAAQTPAELQSAVLKLRAVQEASGFPLTDDAKLAKRMEQLTKAGVKPDRVTRAAALAETNRTRRQLAKLQQVERRMQDIRVGDEFRAEQEGLAGQDPAVQDELNQLHALEETVQASRSGYADSLLSGELNRMYHDWAQSGRKGGFESFAAKVVDAMKTGKDLVKTKVSEDTLARLDDSPEQQPINEQVMEHVVPVLDSPAAATAYAAWPRKAETTFTNEKATFVALVDAHALGNVDRAAEIFQDREGMDAVEARDEAQDFMRRPHVLQWMKEVRDGLAENSKKLPSFVPGKARETAGGGFVWGLENYDAETNRLGKHTLPKTGQLKVAQFKNMAGRGKPLADAEVELARTVVPEAFDAEGNVNVRELYKGLKERGPVLEVKKLGEESANSVRKNFDRMTHEWLDTLDLEKRAEFRFSGETQDQIKYLEGKGWSPEDITKATEYERLGQEVMANQARTGFGSADETTARYSFLGPKSEQEMPGYIEGLVRVPQKKYDPESGTYPASSKYHGPHFGAEDHDVLAFFRGYEETLPDGKKAFHVIEVQSDWAQQKQKQDKFKEHNEPIGRDVASHPLLPVYEQLALKAAIAYAKEIGADAIVLSDAETAMMTEGHDKQTQPQGFGFPIDTAEAQAQGLKVNEPMQAAGMRLHYDQTLPSALSRLTGERGESVNFGTHKGAMSEISDGMLNGSPVFREPTGEAKTSITGRAYPLDKAFSNLEGQGGFTVADASRAPRWTPETPAEQQLASEVKPERGGHGLREWLETSPDPVVQALAKDLKKFGDSLSRVKVNLAEISGEGDARSNADRSAEINLHPMIFSDRGRADTVVAHELLHGLTLAELDNPTNSKVVKEIDALRERLAEQLPPHLKQNYDKAVASDWLSRYDGSPEMLKELGPTWDQQNLVYGLLNNKELISQGFSSKAMQDFMKGKKSDGGASYYNRFKNFVKRLLGFSEGTSAFDEFLSKSDMLLQQGDWVSSLSNFSERYFEGQGLSGPLARSQTKRALGLVQEAANGTNKEMLLDSLDIKPAIRSPEMARAERDLDNMLKQRGDEFQHLTSVMDEQGLPAEGRGLDALAQEVMAGRVSPDVFDLLPQAASKYVFEKVSDMQQVLDMLRSATVEKNKGLLNLADPGLLREPVKQALKATEKLLSAERFQEEAVRNLQGLFSVAPEGFLARTTGDVSRVPGWVKDTVEDTKDGAAGFGSWLKNFLQPAGQLARENPESAEAISKGWQLQANSRKMAAEGMKPFGLDLNGDTGELSHESVKRSVEGLKNPKVQKAADKWIFLNQKEGKKTGETQLLSMNHPEVAKALQGLTEKERNEAIDLVSKQSTSTQIVNAQQLEKMLQIASARGAIIANADNGLTTGQNVQVVETLLQSILDLNDPAKAPLAEQRISAVQGKVSPEAFLELLKFSETEVGKYRAWQEFFDKNPAYATGQRLGKYLVEFKRNGRSFLLQAMTKSEARRLAEGGTETKITENYKGSEDSFPNLGPDAVGLLTRIRELEESQLQMLSGRMTPEQIKAIRDSSPAAQLATEATYRGGIPQVNVPPRGLTKGAEELPWLENHITWVHKTANYWSRQLYRAQMDAHLLERDIAGNPELQKKLRTHAENMLHPDSPTAQKISRFASTWFMGFNLATAMVNMSQPFTTHVAEMTSMTGKPLDSYRRTLNALREIAGERTGKNGWATEEHAWLIHKAAQDGEIDLSMFDDQAAANESVATNYKRAIQLSRPQTLGQRLSTAAGNYSTVGFWLFKQGERINNEAALLSSFDYYREQGLSRDEAYAKATEFNHAVNFGGGRAQRPVGAFSGRGAFPRSAAMLSTSLQSYVLGTTFQLIRYLQKGGFRPAGLAPNEVFAARKAAIQMLGTQLAAAGVLGLPFVSGAISLLDKAFPDLELNKNLRGLMSSLFGEDEGNGNVLSDMAMTGVPSMLGWDLQSRLSMGNTVPGVSEINGFQPELLAGPAVNLVTKFINGGRKLASGDVAGASNDLLPGPVRNLIEAGREATGKQVTDYRNRPLFEATPGEMLGRAVGFNPKRLSDLNASQRILRQSEDVESRRSAQETQRLAELVQRGEFGTVRQTLLAKAQAEPQYNPVDKARAVAQAVEDLTFARDLRREGVARDASQRNKLLDTFGITSPSVSEVQRLQFRLSVEQRLGVPQGDRRAELALAQAMDQLKAAQPSLTRVELRQLAMAALRRSSVRPTLQEPPASL